MSNYIILIHDYRGIGGAQLYAIRRANYLKKNGFSVSFVVTQFDNSLIGTPEGVNIYFSDFLDQPTICLPRKKIKKEIDRFVSNFGLINSSVIETFSKEAATWGELFSQQLGFKHILYCLGEPYVYPFRYRFFLELFLFKYYRGELLGLSDCSLKIILGPHFQERNNPYVNISFDSSEIKSLTEPRFLGAISDNSFVIGTLSRLEKDYVSVLIDDVIELANNYEFKKFTLLICGEGVIPGLQVEDFKRKYSKEKVPTNLHVIFPGYTYPIGKDFFNSIDIFVGMGTAAVSSISQKCATICVDPRVNKSIGVFGVETNNFAYSANRQYFRIKESIENLYLNRNSLELAQDLGYDLFTREFQSEACMKKLDYLIQNSISGNSYFFEKEKSLVYLRNVVMTRITYKLLSIRVLVDLYKGWSIKRNKEG
jgi:hypothetical protein